MFVKQREDIESIERFQNRLIILHKVYVALYLIDGRQWMVFKSMYLESNLIISQNNKFRK